MPSIHYAAVSPCLVQIAAASLGSAAQTHGNGKLVKATKRFCEKPCEEEKKKKERKKEPRLNVSLSHINLEVKEEDVQDEKMLLSWDRASSLQKTYGSGKEVLYLHSQHHFS